MSEAKPSNPEKQEGNLLVDRFNSLDVWIEHNDGKDNEWYQAAITAEPGQDLSARDFFKLNVEDKNYYSEKDTFQMCARPDGINRVVVATRKNGETKWERE